MPLRVCGVDRARHASPSPVSSALTTEYRQRGGRSSRPRTCLDIWPVAIQAAYLASPVYSYASAECNAQIPSGR